MSGIVRDAFIAVGHAVAGGNVISRTYVETTESLSAVSPMTWATGDRVIITGTIEIV